MEWLLDHSDLIVVAILLLAPLLKQIFELKEPQSLPPPRRPEPEANVFETDDDWLTPDAPPTPPPPPPIVATAPPPFPDSTEPADAWQIPRAPRASRAAVPKAAATGHPAPAGGRASLPASSHATTLRTALKNRPETRRALVLREILGPPVGLR